MQPTLLAPVRPPRRPGIDLRCASVTDITWPRADLVIADPPWRYSQGFGASGADDHYDTLPTETIMGHLECLAAVAPRLALWITAPLLDEWVKATANSFWSWGPIRSMGTWVKSGEEDSGHYGQGYHWAGCAEFVLVYASGAHTDRTEPLRNAWIEAPTLHSYKPVNWQAQWIRRWVPEGGLVLDPYAGLGSVAAATIHAGAGRRYLGTEIDPKRHAEAEALIAQVRV